MRVGTPGFVPERLVEAREARRINTREAMARMIGKSASTIQRWEEGDASPEPEALRMLAHCLGVRAEYFLRPSLKEDKPVFFRSQATALKRDKAYQRARIIWLQEVSHVLQHYVELPDVDVPDLVGQRHFTTLTNDDLEGFAEHLRRYWQLGDGPCPNIVGLMERVGFVIASEDMDTKRLDGLCKWCSQEQRPYVLLASDKMSYARRQMDAAHEMAHAVLHRRVDHKEFGEHFDLIERQAFRLASAFLLPRKTYIAEARLPMLTALEVLKERWKVSIKAQIWRLRDLDEIPDDYAQALFKSYSAKGWSKGEPFDDTWALQQPRALAEACNAVVDAKVRSKGDLLHLDFALPAADVESLCGLPRGWFGSEQGPIVRLIPRATDNGPRVHGQILPFKGKRDDE
jgi:Zn-dependent peptidase ImmA (M78 family)/transcriptional regulator with XRE-family HTH domain